MKTLTFGEPKLKELLIEKEQMVKAGRKSSSRIEIIQRKIDESKKVQRKYTEACDPKELIAEGDALEKQINADIERLGKLGQQIQDLKIANIPKTEVAKYEQLKADKEAEERERNKIALRVQKIKDRFIPILQKLVKPYLEKYEDIGSAVLKGDKIVVQVFSDLELWKEQWEKNNGKKEPAALKEAA